MILQNLQLKNIRSYLDEKISFPEGSLLLSGDIGSGKSTVLLAIEFALFGIIKGSVSGSTLLRHGEREGTVEVGFKINNLNYAIKRGLKKGNNGILQTTGYLMKEGIIKEGAPTELTAWIMDILGYPQDLVTKNKSLIFRYSVYTPQEEMKYILLEGGDKRLDVLRKVFGIDKYKKIKENISLVSRSLRNKIKNNEEQYLDLELKKRELQNKEKHVKDIIDQFELKKFKFLEEKKKLEECKIKLNEVEKEAKENQECKRTIELLEVQLKNSFLKREETKKEIEKIESEIIEIKKEIGEEFEIKDHQNDLRRVREEVIELMKRINSLEERKRTALEFKNKIIELDHCPLCMQNVEKDHKKNVGNQQDGIIEDANKKIKVIKIDYDFKNKEKEELEKKVEEQRKKEKELVAIKIKKKNIEEKRIKIKQLVIKSDELKNIILENNSKKIELQSKIIEGLDEKYNFVKKEYENFLNSAHRIEIELTSLRKENENQNSIIEMLKQELKTKEAIKAKNTKLKKYNIWLNEYFLLMIEKMEKSVMARVYHEFNELFQKWFKSLIGEELNTRLDETFNPIIEQNGYETSIENLSGGEKTSCALAYRLALNMVINNVVSSILTKDIIILDEPTDGFSSEQLQKMRDVLDELNLKQVIIVSHEEEIESFVDNVMKVRKESHISNIV